MNNERLNHRAKVLQLASIVNDKRTYNRPMFAIDVNNWGVSEPFTDCENSTIYRTNIFELANDTFIDEDTSEPHYASASYGSIHDY